MLVHIHGQDWNRASETMGVITRPMIDQSAKPLRPVEQDPARSVAQGLRDGDELTAPP